MKLFSNFFSFLLILITLVSCEEFMEEYVPNGYSSNGKSPLQLEEIALPENTYSLLGEAVAFRTVGEGTESVNYTFNFDKWASEKNINVSSITIMSLLEDEVVEIKRLIPDAQHRYCLSIDPKHTYIVYPSIVGIDLYETYLFLGQLSKLGVIEEFANDICTKIYCSPRPYSIEELYDEVPGLKAYKEKITIGNLMVGGLNRPNKYSDVCDLCVNNGLPKPEYRFPSKEPKTIGACSDEDALRVVYERDQDSKSYGPENNELSQIYLWNEVNRARVNLSNNAFNDIQPNVNQHGNWIVFSSERPAHAGQVGIYIMKPDGSQQRHIPGLFGGNPIFLSANEEMAHILYTGDVFDYNVGSTAFYGNIYEAEIDLVNFTVVKNTPITTDAYFNSEADKKLYLYPAYKANGYDPVTISHLHRYIFMKLESNYDSGIPDDSYFVKISSGDEYITIGPSASIPEEYGIATNRKLGRTLWTFYDFNDSRKAYLRESALHGFTGGFIYEELQEIQNIAGEFGNYYAGFDYNKEGNNLLASSAKDINSVDFDVYLLSEDLKTSRLLFGENGIQERFPNFLED